MWSEQCSTDRCDALPLQVHEWFWRETFPLRPLSEMIETYHHSVGNNGVLELDFAIDDTGNVHPTHAAEYKVHGAAGGGRAGGQVADGRRWAQAWRSLESCFLLFLHRRLATGPETAMALRSPTRQAATRR